jgi:hypothetical protein
MSVELQNIKESLILPRIELQFQSKRSKMSLFETIMVIRIEKESRSGTRNLPDLISKSTGHKV